MILLFNPVDLSFNQFNQTLLAGSSWPKRSHCAAPAGRELRECPGWAGRDWLHAAKTVGHHPLYFLAS